MNAFFAILFVTFSALASTDIPIDRGVRVTNFPTTQAVSGTVTCSGVGGSGLTDTQLRASAVPISLATAPTTPVTGAFWQATQPVSGTFWQATQPVSGTVSCNAGTGTLAVSLASAPTTAVTGTFWQSTQPVSIASMPTTAVTLATAPALVAGSAIIGKVGIDQTTPGTTNLVQVGGSLPAGSAVIGHVIADSGSTTAVTGNVASTVADGANVTLGAKADAKSTATDTTAVTVMSVLKQISASVQAPPSQAVTGPLTDTQIRATALPVSLTTLPALVAGSAVIGHVIVDTTSTTAVTQATGANLHAVVDSGSAATTQSGTWTVQPGNTPNTSPWLMTINDGVTSAKVTASSTAAVVNDKALAVAVSPNGGNPCVNPSATLVSITGATSGTAAVQIVALSGTTKIYICSMTIIGVSGTSPTFSLVQGTGSNCASGQTVVKQSWATTAGTLYAYANPVAVGVAGNALCYLDTGTTPIQNYQITYVQQ